MGPPGAVVPYQAAQYIEMLPASGSSSAKSGRLGVIVISLLFIAMAVGGPSMLLEPGRRSDWRRLKPGKASHPNVPFERDEQQRMPVDSHNLAAKEFASETAARSWRTECPFTGRMPTKAPQKSSWFRCLNRPFGANYTRCYFQNVCVDASGALLYFLDGKEQPPELAPDSQPQPLLSLQTYNVIPPRIQFVAGPAPDNLKWYPGLVKYFSSFWPENFGHALDDNFAALWRASAGFGFQWDLDVLYLTLDNRTELCNSTSPEDRRHCEHLKGFGVLLGNGTFSASNPPPEWITANIRTPENEAKSAFCAQHLLAGVFGLTMKNDVESRHGEFVEYMLCRSQLPPRPAIPDPSRLAFFNKTGKRRPINVEAVAAAITKRFKIPVDVLDIASMPLIEQMATMAKYSTVITPCGGISFTTVFLPPGATTLHLCRMEERAYGSRIRVRDFYYSPDDVEKVFNGVTMKEMERNGELAKLRGENRVIFFDNVINVDRFMPYVERALNWVAK